MLEPPDLPVDTLVSCLREAYALAAREITFLPLGADVNTAVYRVTGGDGTPYFLKLRRGDFDFATVAIPHLLQARGVVQVIAPVATETGGLHARLDAFTVVLYPFVAGQDGYEMELSPGQWRHLGVALKALHTTPLPAALAGAIPSETYTPRYREQVRQFQTVIEEAEYRDPVAEQTAVLLRSQRRVITDLLARAERLAADLSTRSLPFVLCHGDIHPGNVLITPDGSLFVVDWDTLVCAPKERDLMFVGFSGSWQGTDREAWFFEGYGPREVEQAALAYFRYERILQDIAAFCEQLLTTNAGGADRPQSLHYLMGSFLPGGWVAAAYRLDRPRYG